MSEELISKLQEHVKELEDKVKEQEDEITRLNGLIKLIEADMVCNKEYDD